MDRLQRLQVFVRVAETGSFTRAADSLRMPRTTVTTAIQKLESDLGTQLLLRTTRRVQLTQDGTAVYQRSLRLLEDYDDFASGFRNGDAPPAGKLRIDVPGRIGRLVLIPALPGFFRRFPGIELDLGVSDHPVDLVRDGVDCAVRVGTLGDSGLVARTLGELQQTNCASPGYLEQHGVPQHPRDLDAHFAVNYSMPATGRVDVWEYVDGDRSVRLDLRSQVTVNNAEAYIAACMAGLGLIQVPAYDVRADMVAGRLVEVMPDWRAPPMPVSLLYPHRRHSPRLKVFVEWCGDVLAERMELEPPS